MTLSDEDPLSAEFERTSARFPEKRFDKLQGVAKSLQTELIMFPEHFSELRTEKFENLFTIKPLR